MIRLKNPQLTGDTFLSLPDSEPVTLYEIPGSNLPYGCQCPLCGGIFEIPAGKLYKIVADSKPDVEGEADFKSMEKSAPPIGGGLPESATSGGQATQPEGFFEEGGNV